MAGTAENVKTVKVLKMWQFKDLNITMKNTKQKEPKTTKRPLSQNFVIINRCTPEKVKHLWEENTNFNVKEIVEVKMELCRVCLGQGSIPIHGDDNREDLAEAIRTFGGIDISIFDSCPKYICERCNELLQGAILFRKTALSTEKLLKISTTSDCNNDVANKDKTYEVDLSPGNSVTHSNAQIKCEPRADDSHSGLEDDFANDEESAVLPHIHLKSAQDSNKLYEKEIPIEFVANNYSYSDSQFAADVNNESNQLFVQEEKQMDLTCKQCNILFDSIQEYKAHKLCRQRHKQRKCSVCKVKSAVRFIKKYNSTKLEMEDKFVCNVCYKNVENMNKTKMDNDLATGQVNKSSIENEINTMTCTKCNITFDEFADYKDHKLNTRKHVKKMCTVCNVTHATRCIMKRHVPLNMRFGYVCDSCYKQYAKDPVIKQEIVDDCKETRHTLVVEPLLVKHEHVTRKLNKLVIKRISDKSKEEPSSFMVRQLKLKCKQCNLLFPAYEQYRAHIRKHHQNMKTCQICNQNYKASYYRKHMKTHKVGHSCMCDVCGKGFNSISALKTHRVIHFNQLPFKCTLCPYKSHSGSLLKIHMRSHTGERPYLCDECPKKFVTKSNLITHKYTHQKERKIKCECGKGFHRKRDLEQHLKADHLGVKEHVCQICGKAFSYRNVMMHHQVRVHKRGKLKSGRKPTYLQSENMQIQENQVSTH